MIPRVLVVGGLDPGGGAGITADARALQAHGAQALPVAVALTAQNRFGLRRVDAVPIEQWRAALATALADGPLHAVKTGMLVAPAQIEALARELAPLAAKVPLVVDPVLSVTAGGYDAPAAVARALRVHLAPLGALLTPNVPELEALGGAGAIEGLLAAGCRAVLCKGGHGRGATVIDRLVAGDGVREFAHARQAVGPVHGTGCALASAIAAGLARGAGVATACERAIEWLQACLAALGPADGSGRPRPLPILNGTSPR